MLHLFICLDRCGLIAMPLAGILYTIYGHHLWDRRDKVLHAMGLAGDDIEDLKFP